MNGGLPLSSSQTNSTPATHSIPHAALTACGLHYGIDIRPASQGGDIQIGDILFIRSGFVQQHRLLTLDARVKLAARKGRETQFAGVAQEEAMLDWLHDCYFAAVAGDAPAFEAWPAKESE